MNFDSASAIDQITWSMRMANYPRSKNRALINQLFNGAPPYSQEEAESNNVSINCNFLEAVRLSHDSRAQYYQAFLKPGNFFTCTTDYGSKSRRASYKSVVTKEVNRIMKRSIPYTEKNRSTFAQDVLHGIGPGSFRDSDHWCPDAIGIEDVMVPANTLLTMVNLPFFAIHRSFTAPELIKLTKGPNVDKAWNMTLVNDCLEWIDKETSTLMGTNWPDVWTPEKSAERQKSNGGFYASDQVPTIEAWDFYFWNDDEKVAGWNRRMILDSWGSPAMSGSVVNMSRKTGELYSKRDQFLYNPGKRKWADCREEIINWQFADLSAVAPFRYDCVRGFGFLTYAVCHLQNRMRCKFNESVFEQLMIYFRVNSADDVQKALKIEMVTRGFIDQSVQFIPAAERYQVNTNLVELGLNENANLIAKNSQSQTPSRDESGRGGEKPTATQWMGEESKITQLVSAGLMQAYLYQVPEYREIFRRFCKKNSTDPDVRRFQANVLKQGVPEELLNPELWELEPERVLGAGNKSLEMAVAQQLMQYRNLYDPEPQRDILRDFTLAVTDDAGRADAYVPQQPMKVSDSVHDAQLAAGTLMLGLPVAIKTGMNHIEYVETLMVSMATIIQRINQNGQMATPDQLVGLQNMGQNIGQHIGLIAQDQKEKARVKEYGDQLGKLMNLVKAFAQRLEEQMKQQQAQNGDGADAELQAKLKATQILAEQKKENQRSSHAEKTAQRQVQFEREEQMAQARFQTEMQQEQAKAAQELQVQGAKSALELAKEKEKAKQQANKPKPKSE